MDPKEKFREILREGALRFSAEEIPLSIERPANPEHGDYASNIALQLSKRLRRNPRQIAEEIARASAPALAATGLFEPLTVAGAGFLNIRVKPAAKLQSIKQVLEQGPRYGRARDANVERVQVEFVSANPTGPLHVGHGRQGALGDAIAALLESQGHVVTREFYYNDAGAQIDKLALSVQARAKGIKPGEPGWPAEGYAGEYIEDISRDFLNEKQNPENLEAIRKFAVAYLRAEQDADLQAFGVRFDNYYLESSLYSDGKVAEVVESWKKNKKTYEHEGALWLRTTEYGDDKDRVA